MSLFPEEPLKSPKGYFHGQLNQTLNNGRWTLIRKLGWGSRSSCWLATDSEDPDNVEAIKIYTVSASKGSSSANERDVLQKMWDSDIFSNVPVKKDSFYEESGSGAHLCIVLHLLGPSVVSLLDDSTESGRYLPLHAVKQVVGDVLEALCSLHKNSIIHGGVCDFHITLYDDLRSTFLPAVMPHNVLLPSYQQGPDIRDFISKNPSDSVEEVADRQGKVYHIVKSQPLNTYGLKRESTATDIARNSFYLSNYSHGKQVALSSRSSIH